jgi:RimJ/RimL family protein N-acetyltransferase
VGDLPEAYLYAVRRADSGEVVGHAELGHVDRRNRSAKLMRILIGPEELRGSGLGEQVVRALVEIGFGRLDLHRLDLHVFEFNTGAVRCYERAGFRLDGTLRDARRHEGGYWNLCIMGLLRPEWEAA